MGPYASAADAIADGHSSTGNAVLALNKYFAQTPQPAQAYIGRRATAPAQLVTLTPVSLVNGTVYDLTVDGLDVTYTVSGSPTLATVCTAIATALGAAATASGATVTGASGTHVAWTTTTAGQLVDFRVTVPASILRITESTTISAGTLAADLTAIWAENKNWYGLLLDSNSKVEVLEAAAWVETNGVVIMAASTSDSDVPDNTVSTDVGTVGQSNSYKRSAVILNQYSNKSYGAAAWLGGRFTAAPGSDTWHLKTLASVQVDSDLLVPQSSVSGAQAKNVTVYTALAGLNLTQGGKALGGTFMDQTRLLDWFKANVQIRTIGLMASLQKVPYTDAGVMLLEGILKQVYEEGVAAGGFVPGSLVVNTPKVATIASSFKQSRTFPGIPFTGQFQGAIHSTAFNGVLIA